jgi:hypothetical protein
LPILPGGSLSRLRGRRWRILWSWGLRRLRGWRLRILSGRTVCPATVATFCAAGGWSCAAGAGAVAVGICISSVSFVTVLCAELDCPLTTGKTGEQSTTKVRTIFFINAQYRSPGSVRFPSNFLRIFNHLKVVNA